jgi:hypothetical protein
MSKANISSTANPALRHEAADSWRLAQLRRRAAGKGKRPMPHGRYSATKRTLRHGVLARPALTADQAEVLWEICTLSAYSDGFTHTEEMAAVCREIADTAGRPAIAMCLARADIRERAIVQR